MSFEYEKKRGEERRGELSLAVLYNPSPLYITEKKKKMRCKVNKRTKREKGSETMGVCSSAFVDERKEHVCSKASAREQIVHSSVDELRACTSTPCLYLDEQSTDCS